MIRSADLARGTDRYEPWIISADAARSVRSFRDKLAAHEKPLRRRPIRLHRTPDAGCFPVRDRFCGQSSPRADECAHEAGSGRYQAVAETVEQDPPHRAAAAHRATVRWGIRDRIV